VLFRFGCGCRRGCESPLPPLSVWRSGSVLIGLRQQSHRWRRVCRRRERIDRVAVGVSDRVVGSTCPPPQATTDSETRVKPNTCRRIPPAPVALYPSSPQVILASVFGGSLTERSGDHPATPADGCVRRPLLRLHISAQRSVHQTTVDINRLLSGLPFPSLRTYQVATMGYGPGAGWSASGSSRAVRRSEERSEAS
jgi:hypothetical protein